MPDEAKIPKGRIRRSAKLGSIIGTQGARYAGTKAANVARSEEEGKQALEARHLETAMKMVGALGQMKGAAMKLGQFASFIDTEFIPVEYRELYQERLKQALDHHGFDCAFGGARRARCAPTSALCRFCHYWSFRWSFRKASDRA